MSMMAKSTAGCGAFVLNRKHGLTVKRIGLERESDAAADTAGRLH